MAKKQIIDYSFDPSRKTVTLKSNVLRERLLLITNVTTNTLLYNFAEPSLGLAGDPVYNELTNETDFVLIKDTSTMSATDNLSIYIEGESTAITPDNALMDSVGKLRVSNPESLIDTDFEYGLQSTKWETLRMVNNIPSFYSRTGDTPIVVTAVTVTAGQKTVEVTAPNHGLSNGIPFEINGLADPTFEGGYVVVSVPTPNTFIYKVSFTPTLSGAIQTIYTSVLPGAFYTGSSMSISSVTTNAADPSTITINTVFPHGLNPGAEIYLVNTTATKKYSFNAAQVRSNDIEQKSATINPGAAGENAFDYRARPVIIDDIIGSNEKYFSAGSVDVANNIATINNHGFLAGQRVLFYTTLNNTVPAGLADWNVYHLHPNTTPNTLAFAATTATNTQIDITTQGTSSNGPFRVVRAQGIQSIASTNIQIDNHGLQVGQQVIFVRPSGSTSTVTGITLSTHNRSPFASSAGYVKYWVVNTTTNTFRISTTQNGAAISPSFTTGNGGGVFAVRVVDTPEANCFYAQNHGFSNNDYVLYIAGGTAATPLVTNTRYTIEPVGVNYFRVKDRTSGAVINLTAIGTVSHGFTRTTTHRNRDTIRIPGLAGTLTNNQIIQYNSSGGTLIGGLTDNNYYQIKTVGFSQSDTVTFPGDLSSNYLRLSNVNQSTRVPLRNDVVCLNLTLAANATTITMTTSGANFVAGDRVMIYGASDDFFNDVYTVAVSPAPTATSVTLQLPTDGAVVYKNNTVAKTLANSGQAFVIVDLTSVGSGTQILQQDSSKAADDIYAVADVGNSRSFTATASASIPTNTFSFNPGDVAQMSQGSGSNHWFRIADHRLADGVRVTYSKGASGNSPIGGLVDNTDYFVVVRDKDYFSLSSTITAARERNINIDINSVGSGSSHTFTTNSINSFLVGDGYIFTTSKTANEANLFVRGVRTKFLSTFTPGDIFKFYTSVQGAPGTFYALEIDSVKSDTIMKLKSSPNLETTYRITNATYAGTTATFTTSSSHGFTPGQNVQVTGVGVTGGTLGLSGYNSTSQTDGSWIVLATPTLTTFTVTIATNPGTFNSALSDNPQVNGLNRYFIPTGLYVKSDAITTHRPFDGGVNITSGNLPNSTIIRQTRRYFRYQPGKGIQVSLSINFNPPFDVQRITSNGSTATVVTKTPHYLKPNGSYQVKISEAQVPTGANPYNGTFDVGLIIDDYTFTYTFITYTATGTRTNGSTTISSINKTFTGNINNVATPTNPVNRITGVTPTNIVSLQIGMTISGTGIPSNTRITSIRTAEGIVFLNNAVTSTATGVTFTVTNILDFIQSGTSVTGTGIPASTVVVDVFSATNEITISNAATSSGASTPLTFPANASSSIANGFPKFNLVNWTDAVVRAGLYDTQNGMFFEYDGSNLYCVRRSSIQQISGTVTVTNRSCLIEGDGNARFNTQLTPGDYVVIRGQSYLITQIDSASQMYVQPEYRGVTINNAIVTKTIDTKTPQYEWNLDKADGYGIHGYVLDINRIQMVYLDYSWYGAGKIRYGFKDQNGEVKYFHEYIHNNKFTEAYFRAGNLPARYEVNTFGNPTFSPSLFHWGTSVIMDGRYDGDKAYLFTADSNTLSFTNGGNTTFSGNLVLGSNIIRNISATDVAKLYVGAPITIPEGQTGFGAVPENTTILTIYQQSGANTYNALMSANAAAPAGSGAGTTYSTLTISSGIGTIFSLAPIPLVSIRLAPSVDNSTTGLLGFRELINRMQLTLKTVGLLCTHDSIVQLRLNGQLSNDTFTTVGAPALSQLYRHAIGDTIQGGTTIFSFRAAGGANISGGTTSAPVRRALNNTEQDLGNLALIGNAILGGNNVYPNGPDILTVVITPVDTSQITANSPFQVSSRLTWTEAQA
jgi:hypothetical protein